MFHSEVFDSSNGTSGVVTPLQVNYVSAGALLPSISTNGMQVSFELPYLAFIAGVAANMVSIRPQSSSMTPFPYPNLNPNNRGTAFESPPRVWDFFRTPMKLLATEEFDIFATQNSGGAQNQRVLCSFSDGAIMPLTVQVNPGGMESNPRTPGRFFTAHATGTTTLTASGWTSVTPSFDQILPAGMYAVIGMRFFSATARFARLAPASGPKWKPGGCAVQAYDSLDPWNQRAQPISGGVVAPWGIWLTFYQNVPPTVEFYATAADTAEEIWFDLVYMGPNFIQGI